MPHARGKRHPKPSLPKTKKSCTECRRRKQRCSGTWPCVHCTRRNVTRSCHFEPADSPGSIESGLIPGESVEIDDETTLDSHTGGHDPPLEKADVPNLRALGYLRGNEHFQLDELEIGSAAQQYTIEQDDTLQDKIRESIGAMPGRLIVDGLVNHYLQNLNSVYSVIHPSTFLEDYANWFRDRANGRSLPPSFTCLLLQICASAAQEPSESLRRQIEYDLAEDCSYLSKKLQNAANVLSCSISPGDGNIHQVLRLLIAASTSKTQGRMVDAWHYVGAAVREEQECGMHDPLVLVQLHEADGELRKRVWCFTVLWDWQMAQWLSRPMFLDISDCDLEFPNLGFDSAGNGLPSPFSNTFHQYRLVHTLFKKFGRLDSPADFSRLREIGMTIERWAAELPPEMREFDGPGQWDADCSWLPVQRAHLHCFAAMVAFTPLRRHLLPLPVPREDHSQQAIDLAWHAGIRCIEAALRLYESIELPKSRYHFVIFALADTSMMICSALLHDTACRLPRRDDLYQAAHKAGKALRNISIANSSASAASRIVQHLLWRVGPATAQSAPSQHSSSFSAGRSRGLSEPLSVPRMSSENCEAMDPSAYEEISDVALPDLESFLDPKYTFEELLGISLEESQLASNK